VPNKLDRDDVDLTLLTEELSERLGRPVAVSARFPGQTDEDGAELPGVLIVVDAESGESLDDDVDGRTVAAVIRAHVRPEPPPTPEQAQQAREQAIAAAESKASKGDTAGALADLFALLREQPAAAPPQA
jgi:hypothetical protein